MENDLKSALKPFVLEGIASLTTEELLAAIDAEVARREEALKEQDIQRQIERHLVTHRRGTEN